jgi:hypothetical protein
VRAEGYRQELSKVFGRPLVIKDSVTEPRLRKAERRLGSALPQALREFYRVAGAASETRGHNLLFRPEDLVVERGYLVFMQENQAVVDWGIPRRFLETPDPPVWQRVNEEKPGVGEAS